VQQIIAIVKPFLAEQVIEGLKRAPVEAVTVCEVKGYGRQKSYLDEYGESEFSLAFLPKIEICIWVEDLRLEEVLRQVRQLAHTGRIGDGKILVLGSVRQAKEGARADILSSGRPSHGPAA
jgi:nitrogen regulatory protein P-II 1